MAENNFQKKAVASDPVVKCPYLALSDSPAFLNIIKEGLTFSFQLPCGEGGKTERVLLHFGVYLNWTNICKICLLGGGGDW